MDAGCANPTEKDILENVNRWAAARSRLKKRSSRATSQEAGETAREATPLEPPALVEAATHTFTERTAALNLPLHDTDTAPVGFGLGRSTAQLGTGTDLLLSPAAMGGRFGTEHGPRTCHSPTNGVGAQQLPPGLAHSTDVF